MAQEELIAEAIRIIEAGERVGTPLRLLGGLAVRLTSPSAVNLPALQRTYADIDFIGLEHDGAKIKEAFRALEYKPDERFNALHGRTRLIFYPASQESHIDIFLDQFEMCHTFDLRKRLFPGYQTLSIADLLLTKLQIVQLNQKDLVDILSLLLDHEVMEGEQPGGIDLGYIAQLSAGDWGLFTTLRDNLDITQQAAQEILDADAQAQVIIRAQKISKAMENVPKSARWKLRAKIGRRMEWYELPEEVRR